MQLVGASLSFLNNNYHKKTKLKYKIRNSSCTRSVIKNQITQKAFLELNLTRHWSTYGQLMHLLLLVIPASQCHLRSVLKVFFKF